MARRPGIDIGALKPADRHVGGVVEMVLDATANYSRPLTAERRFGWNAALFPAAYGGISPENVHFEHRPRRHCRRSWTRFSAGSIPMTNLDPRLKAARALLVRQHPSLRRWQRPHCARHRRYAVGPFGGQPAAILQHVGADPAGTQGVSRHPGAHAKSHPGHPAWMVWCLACLDHAIESAQAELAATSC
jgi:hypothetical protein